MRIPVRARLARGLLVALLLSAAGVHAEPAPAAVSGKIERLRPLQRSTAEWRALFATIPQLASRAAEWKPLPPTATDDALERGRRTRAELSGWTFLEGAFEWSPQADRRVWIVPGVASGRIVIAVLEPGDTPKHLASAVLVESKPVLAIASAPGDLDQLVWTTCYGCAGHGGSIRLDQNGRPAFQYR